MIDLSNYNVYQNKDGRYRAYNKTTHKVTSYPRDAVNHFFIQQNLNATENLKQEIGHTAVLNVYINQTQNTQKNYY